MDLQYFGTIESNDRNVEAMLSMDVDRPAECMLHVWGEGVAPKALLCECQILDDGAHLLIPRTLFLVAEKGGIYPALVPEEDRAKFDSTRATLRAGHDGTYHGSWVNGIGEGGVIRLLSSAPTEVKAVDCDRWADFREWANFMRRDKQAIYFRGHGSSKFALTTTLQRNGRNRLERYCAETLQQFHRHAEAALNIRIDMNNGDDYSMLLGLAQHFGLPTPLLDWSTSPYVAAFFAFADALENRAARQEAEKIRIFALTEPFVTSHRTPSVVLPYFKPYVSPLEMSFRNNPRLYAQQGCFIVTNHSDLSGVIRKAELDNGKEYLFAVDMPARLAVEVLQDLAYMGLSGATLFPGLDGVSRMLKHEMAFGHLAPEVVSKPTQDPPALPDGGSI